MAITLQESWPVACIGWLDIGSTFRETHRSVAYVHSSISSPASNSSASVNEFEISMGKTSLEPTPLRGESIICTSSYTVMCSGSSYNN